jgi:hypothetical protein
MASLSEQRNSNSPKSNKKKVPTQVELEGNKKN